MEDRGSPALQALATWSNRHTHRVTATTRRADVTATRRAAPPPRHTQHLARHPRDHSPRLSIAQTRGGERGEQRPMGHSGAAGVA